MNPDLVLPVIASLGWLLFAIAAFASFRLHWSKVVKMALVWIALFVGLFLIVEWFSIARDTTSALL